MAALQPPLAAFVPRDARLLPEKALRGEVALPEQRVVKGLPGALGSGAVSDARKEASARVARRWAAMRPPPQLAIAAYSEVFSLAPRSRAEFAAMGRGEFAKLRPAATQTNEEACAPPVVEGSNRQARLGRETQTDEIRTAAVGAQVPEDAARDEGSSRARGSGTVDRSGGRARATLGSLAGRGAQTMRLGAFMRRAGNAIVALLEDVERAGDGAAAGAALCGSWSTSSVGVSARCAALEPSVAGLLERRVADMAYDAQGSVLLVAYDAASGGSGGSSTVDPRLGAVVMWDLQRPGAPERVLGLQGVPTCVCWGAGAQTRLAFAGTDAGSIAAWDVRERLSGAAVCDKLAPAPPVYASDFDQARNHAGPVVAVAAASWGKAPEGMRSGNEENGGGGGDADEAVPRGAFALERESMGGSSGGEDGRSPGGLHLVSLDERSVAHVWSVTDVEASADAAGYADDLGLRIGGTARLVRAATVDLMRGKRVGSGVGGGNVAVADRRRTYALALSPIDGNDFVAAADSGTLLRGAQYGAPPPPRAYGPALAAGAASEGQDSSVFGMGDATVLAFSPSMPSLFIAGCADGRVALHSLHASSPLSEWHNLTNGSPVAGVAWVPTRPAAFVVLGVDGVLHVLSLVDDPIAPILSERVASTSAAATSLRSARVPNDSGATLALGFADGRVEVHLLSPAVAASKGDAELEVLEALVAGAAIVK